MKENKDYQNIPGWGVDADPENDPVYPIRKLTGDEHKGYSWERPVQQPVDMEVLHSNERPNVSSVFGTSVPPTGLSGLIRRCAFKYSESSYGHWLPLLLADRVNGFEGIIQDVSKGKFPDMIAERGLGMEWKYNKKLLVRKVLISTAVAALAVALLSRKKRR